MRAYVFTDAALARHAGRFVWLELNTDVPGNAQFLEKYPVENWPTLFIIDPREEKALVRFAGSATHDPHCLDVAPAPASGTNGDD